MACILASLLFTATATAQAVDTGVIEGRVSNAAAGSFLNNVRITVEGTALEAFTNEAGEFRLLQVPAGEVTLKAAVAGLGQETARIMVAAGRTVRRDFDLGGQLAPVRDQTVVLEPFTVVERELSAQASALQEQRTAPNIKNVVAFEEFGDLGEGNAGEFLKFVPGIQVAMSPAIPGDATIRGMPSSGTVLTVDGVELASDNPVGRGAGFTSSNTANMDRIEVTKVPTPDLPANAVGGSINIVSKSGFSRRVPQFTYNAFGTLTSIQPLTRLGKDLVATGGPDGPTNGRHTRPGFDFTYLRPINPSLALSVSGGHNVRWEDKDHLIPTWNRVTLVQTQSSINAQVAARHRNVASFRVDWRPWAAHTLYASLSFTSDDVYSRQHAWTQAYGSGATGGKNFTQGTATGVGSVSQGMTYRNQLKKTMLGAAGYRYDGNGWRFESNIAHSEARRRTLSATDEETFFGTVNASIPNLVLRAEGFSGQPKGTPPRITALNRAGQPIDITDGRLYSLNSVSSPQEPLMSHQLTTLKAAVSRELDYRVRTRLMLGGQIAQNVRDIHSHTRSWAFRPGVLAAERAVGNLDLINEPYSAKRSFRTGDRVGWLDPHKVYRLYQEQPSWFVLNEASAHTSFVNGSRKLEETVSAGFLRADFKAFDNRLWVVAGVRYERTDDEGSGPLNDVRATYRQDADGNLVRDAAGRPIRVSTDALTIARQQYQERGSHAKKSYGDYYPSLNASYSVTENLVARAAFARTIGRPNLNFIIPTRSVTDPAATEQNRVINTTNTGLEPWAADNYDLSFETYSMKGATVAVSLFRKNISNFFVSTRTDATLELLEEMGLSDEYLDYDVITQTNSADSVTLDGVEWSWRQSLKPFDFVPAWAKGFQVWMNGTHLTLSGVGQDNFAGYSPRIINSGVSYANARFLAKLNVSRIGRTRSSILPVSSTVPPGTYQAQDTRTVMDGSVEYRLHKGFALYTSVRNLANEPRPLITYSPNAPAYTLSRGHTFYGALWTFGVKGTF